MEIRELHENELGCEVITLGILDLQVLTLTLTANTRDWEGEEAKRQEKRRGFNHQTRRGALHESRLKSNRSLLKSEKISIARARTA